MYLSPGEIHGHCALIDWSSVERLLSPEVDQLLDTPISSAAMADAFREYNDTDLFDLLARFVLYDALILDGQWATRKPQFRDSMGPNLIVGEFPPDSYRQAWDAVEMSITRLQSQGILTEETLSSDSFFQGDVKAYVDQISRALEISGRIVNSDYSVPHTIFYLELARTLNVGNFLSPRKRTLLQDLRRKVRQDAIAFVDAKIAPAVNAVLRSAIQDATAEFSFGIPPVLDLVLRYAEQHKGTLRQALRHVRETNEAGLFREKLSAVQRRLGNGLPGRLEADDEIIDLIDAAEQWEKRGRITDERSPVLMNIGVLPHIGSLAKLVGLDQLAIPTGRYPSYVSFVVSWFASTVPKAE